MVYPSKIQCRVRLPNGRSLRYYSKRRYDPKYPVVCMDESSKQLIKDVREPLAAKPGQVYKYEHRI